MPLQTGWTRRLRAEGLPRVPPSGQRGDQASHPSRLFRAPQCPLVHTSPPELGGRKALALGTWRGEEGLGWGAGDITHHRRLFPRPTQGRFTIAAKHHISIAEIYETELVDIEKVSGSRGGRMVGGTAAVWPWGWMGLVSTCGGLRWPREGARGVGRAWVEGP